MDAIGFGHLLNINEQEHLNSSPPKLKRRASTAEAIRRMGIPVLLVTSLDFHLLSSFSIEHGEAAETRAACVFMFSLKESTIKGASMDRPSLQSIAMWN